MFHCVVKKFFLLLWLYLRITSWVWFFRGENVSFTEGILRVPDISVPAKLKYRIKNVPSDFIVETDYLVLGTDYHSFAVVFTCAEYGTSLWVHYPSLCDVFLWFCAISFFYFAYFSLLTYSYTHGKLEKTTFSNYQRMWILTRQQKPAAAVIEKANAVLNDKKIIKSTSFHTSPVC